MPWWFSDDLLENEPQARRLPFGQMVRRVAPLFRPHVRSLLVGVLLLLVSVGAQLAGPLVLWRLIDVDVAQGSRSGVVTSALTYAALFLVGAAATYLQVVVLTKMGLSIVAGLKGSLFGHLLRLSLAYFDKNTPGTLLARVESDTERLQALFSEVSIAVFRTLILIAGMLVVMLAVNWQATLAVLALAVPLVLVTIFFFRWMRGLYQKVRHLYARISAFVTEYVQGVPVLQIFGYEHRAAARLAALNQDKLAADRRASLLEYGFWGFLGAMEVAAVMVILYAGSGRWFGVAMTGGTFVLFLEYTRQAFWPLAMFAEQIGFIQRAFASADRVFGVLDTPSRTPERAGASETVPDDWRELTFERIGFAYDGGTRALDDVSFSVRRGERVALVGLSGGGKTTLTNLLLRFYEPTEGRIALDGTDIRDFTQRAWRQRIGLVLQDIHLFPGTVGDNLRALVDEIPQENLDRAVGIVGAETVIAGASAGLRRGPRRGRRQPLDGGAAAPQLRARHRPRPGSARARRGDLLGRPGDRAATPGLGRPTPRRSDEPHHRPPAGDDRERRPDPRRPPGADRRDRARTTSSTCRAASTATSSTSSSTSGEVA